MRSTAGPRNQGFTLIELLTVIAIIAVLAAILFPVLSSARQKAWEAQCMSNMKQLGQAITLYEGDYAGFLPPWSVSNPTFTPPPSPNTPGNGVITWDMSISEYVRDNRILICHGNPNGSNLRSYAMAQYTQRFVNASTPFFGVFKDSIPAPTKTILLFEKGANPPGCWGDALGQNVYQSHNSAGETGYNDKPFHYNGKNFLYVDGHVKFWPEGAGPFAYKSARSGAQPGDVMYPGMQKDGGDWPNPD